MNCMKKLFLSSVILIVFNTMIMAQSVVVSTTVGNANDTTAMLEVQKQGMSKLNVRSMNYLDTAWIQLSNKNASQEGTNFNIVALQEQGLFFNTSSDLPEYSNDSILTLLVNGNVGIGTKSPAEKLEIKGKIKINDGSEGNGKILQSDANGVGSWVLDQKPAFIAQGTSPTTSNKQLIPTGINSSNLVTIINNESYDPNGMYDPATGVVTIPETGTYHIDAKIHYESATPGQYLFSLRYRLLGSSIDNFLRNVSAEVDAGSLNLPMSISCDVWLNAGYTLRLYTSHSAATARNISGSFETWLNIRKVN